MTDLNRTDTARRPVPVALIIVLIVAAAIAGVAGYFLSRGPAPVKEPVLTDEARAYIRSGNLKLSAVEMGAKESFAKQMLVEITGKISNTGDRPVKLVEITCVFTDPAGQPVYRERQAIVSERMGGLMPGQTKAFRLAFDNLPQTWNQGMPQLVIAQIVFG